MAGTATWVASQYDRLKELKTFDETKAGVKGLVDSGVKTIPQIFARPAEELAADHPISDENTISVPIIDLSASHADCVSKIGRASEEMGFFQVVNHGISCELMEGMSDGVRRFHELPREIKMEFYTRSSTKTVKFNSNFDLYKTESANWRDTLFVLWVLILRNCLLSAEILQWSEIGKKTVHFPI